MHRGINARVIMARIIMGIAMFGLIGHVLLLSNAAEQGKNTPQRNWWIYAVGITGTKEGKATFVSLKLGVCATDKELISKLTDESWEIQPGPGTSAGVIMVHDPIAGVDRDEDFHVPLKMVMIAGRDDDENLKALLSTSVRLKGEQVWLRLSDVIRIEGGEYSIYRCSRCGADLKSGEGKCANCGAQYGRRK